MENCPVKSLAAARCRIQSGDLLVWHKGGSGWLSDLIIRIIRLFTLSEYGHVGIAYRDETGLYVLEATMPLVRLTPVEDLESFYWIPMRVRWSDRYKTLMDSYVGCRYSVRDAVFAYLGFTVKHDNRWQCVELAHELYESMGVNVPTTRLTPAAFVQAAMITSDSGIYYVQPNGVAPAH